MANSKFYFSPINSLCSWHMMQCSSRLASPTATVPFSTSQMVTVTWNTVLQCCLGSLEQHQPTTCSGSHKLLGRHTFSLQCLRFFIFISFFLASGRDPMNPSISPKHIRASFWEIHRQTHSEFFINHTRALLLSPLSPQPWPSRMSGIYCFRKCGFPKRSISDISNNIQYDTSWVRNPGKCYSH